MMEAAAILSNDELDQQVIALDRAKRFILFADLKAESSKEWLVSKLLGHGEASVMYGKPGDGKSVLGEDLALHVAAGWPWHGRPVRRGAVLYVAMERKELVKRRAIAFRKHYSCPDLPFAVAGDVLDFRDPRTADKIIEIGKEVEECTGESLVLVVLDTLSRGLCGGDENSSKDMGAIVANTGRLQQGTGAHIMWIHHMPQEAERMRGHGALLGAVDATILVSRFGSTRAATIVKANDAEEGQQIAFTLESVVVGEDGETTAPVVVADDPNTLKAEPDDRLSKNQQTMFALLHEAGTYGLTTDQWNDKARDAGIGVKRRADLVDIRMALEGKHLIRKSGERWTVRH